MWQRRDESQRTAALIERESGFGIVEIHELVIDTRCLQANCKCAPNARNVQVRNANYRPRLWSALDVTIQCNHSVATFDDYHSMVLPLSNGYGSMVIIRSSSESWVLQSTWLQSSRCAISGNFVIKSQSFLFKFVVGNSWFKVLNGQSSQRSTFVQVPADGGSHIVQND